MTTIAAAQFDLIHRFAIDQEILMLERLRAQTDLLAAARAQDKMVFIDTDTLVLRDLFGAFETSYDIGVTIRDQPKFHFERVMPYNNGVILVNCKRPSCARAFFYKLTSALEGAPFEWRAWSGNQFIVRDTLGVRSPGSIVRIGNTLIKVFSCGEYNYTPVTAGEDVRSRAILHFRGEAKPLMQTYASAYQMAD
jgi:hypothetical protein